MKLVFDRLQVTAKLYTPEGGDYRFYVKTGSSGRSGLRAGRLERGDTDAMLTAFQRSSIYLLRQAYGIH